MRGPCFLISEKEVLGKPVFGTPPSLSVTGPWTLILCLAVPSRLLRSEMASESFVQAWRHMPSSIFG